MRQFKAVKHLFLCLILTGLCSAQSLAPQLELKSVVLEDGSKIDFLASLAERDTPNAVVLLSETENFQIWAGPVLCEYLDEYRFFRYRLYVKKRMPEQWFCFLVNGAPQGQFADRFEDVPYTIAYEGVTESKELRLPLHSLSSGQCLNPMLLQGKEDQSLDKALLKVWVGSDQIIPLVLINKLQDMKLIVRSVQLSYIHPDFWASHDASVRQELRIAEGARTILNDLKIRARPMKVIPNTFFRLKGGEDSRLKLAINYEAQAGGNPRELDTEIRIRFFPSLWYLILAILAGASLGTTVRLINRKTRASIKTWLKVLGTAILNAGGLELLGIVLASLDSEFKIFGLVLDPFQFSHVMGMAMLIGVLGINIVDIVKQLLGLWKDKPGVEPVGGEEGGPP